jgi:HNH endonuclease
MFKCRGRCWYCGRHADTIDHAKPRSRGGKNLDYNLLPACWDCNNDKSDMTVSEFRRYVRAMVIRKLIPMGLAMGRDLTRMPIVFYGEGNTRPLWWYADPDQE